VLGIFWSFKNVVGVNRPASPVHMALGWQEPPRTLVDSVWLSRFHRSPGSSRAVLTAQIRKLQWYLVAGASSKMVR